MSKINYNRHNGGYELEPWRKSTSKPVQLLPLKEFPEHKGHSITLTKTKPGSVHAGAYRCIDCNKHLAWASRGELL